MLKQFRPAVNVLEGRACPATVYYQGDAAHPAKDWDDPTAWVGGVVPAATDDVVVNVAATGNYQLNVRNADATCANFKLGNSSTNGGVMVGLIDHDLHVTAGGEIGHYGNNGINHAGGKLLIDGGGMYLEAGGDLVDHQEDDYDPGIAQSGGGIEVGASAALHVQRSLDFGGGLTNSGTVIVYEGSKTLGMDWEGFSNLAGGVVEINGGVVGGTVTMSDQPHVGRPRAAFSNGGTVTVTGAITLNVSMNYVGSVGSELHLQTIGPDPEYTSNYKPTVRFNDYDVNDRSFETAGTVLLDFGSRLEGSKDYLQTGGVFKTQNFAGNKDLLYKVDFWQGSVQTATFSETDITIGFAASPPFSPPDPPSPHVDVMGVVDSWTTTVNLNGGKLRTTLDWGTFWNPGVRSCLWKAGTVGLNVGTTARPELYVTEINVPTLGYPSFSNVLLIDTTSGLSGSFSSITSDSGLLTLSYAGGDVFLNN